MMESERTFAGSQPRRLKSRVVKLREGDAVQVGAVTVIRINSTQFQISASKELSIEILKPHKR